MKFPHGSCLINLDQVGIDDASRTHSHVPNLTVANLPFREPNRFCGSVEERVRILSPERVKKRSGRGCDGVVRRVLPVSPSVQDDQTYRSFAHTLDKHVACVLCFFTKYLFDAKKFIVFCCSICARDRARLYLSRAQANGEVRDGRVLRFSRAMRYDRAPSGFVRHIDGSDGLGERAYLVDLDENGVRCFFIYPPLEKFYIRDQKIVADYLRRIFYCCCKFFPSVPIIFGKPVFYRKNWVFFHELGIPLRHFF